MSSFLRLALVIGISVHHGEHLALHRLLLPGGGQVDLADSACPLRREHLCNSLRCSTGADAGPKAVSLRSLSDPALLLG